MGSDHTSASSHAEIENACGPLSKRCTSFTVLTGYSIEMTCSRPSAASRYNRKEPCTRTKSSLASSPSKTRGSSRRRRCTVTKREISASSESPACRNNFVRRSVLIRSKIAAAMLFLGYSTPSESHTTPSLSLASELRCGRSQQIRFALQGVRYADNLFVSLLPVLLLNRLPYTGNRLHAITGVIARRVNQMLKPRPPRQPRRVSQ